MDDAMPAMPEVRFYFFASLGALSLAVFAAVAMTAVGIGQGQVATVDAIILGFAVQIIAQYRAAAAAAANAEQVRTALEESTALQVRKAEEVKTALKVSSAEVARKADEVKRTLESSNIERSNQLADIQATATAAKATGLETQRMGEAVHALVNSAMSVQLKVSAVALRRVADLTGDADDVAAAELAEKAFHAHEAKQKIVDDSKIIAGPPGPPSKSPGFGAHLLPVPDPKPNAPDRNESRKP